MKKVLNALAAISIIYGAVVLFIIGPGHWFNFAFEILGAALALLSFFWDKIIKWNKFVLITLGVAIALVFINFGVFEVKLISASLNTYDSSVDEVPKWVIVLGAKVDSDGRPKLEFAVRLRKAEEVCTDASNLILTGGQGIDEPITEAECADNYLSQRATVKAKEIVLEDKSESTSENLENALAIIQDNGGDASDRVLIISSSFHLYRASKLAQEAGYTNTCYSGAAGLKLLMPYYCVREYAAYVRECI